MIRREEKKSLPDRRVLRELRWMNNVLIQMLYLPFAISGIVACLAFSNPLPIGMTIATFVVYFVHSGNIKTSRVFDDERIDGVKPKETSNLVVFVVVVLTTLFICAVIGLVLSS